jgi:hypothetical protein
MLKFLKSFYKIIIYKNLSNKMKFWINKYLKKLMNQILELRL